MCDHEPTRREVLYGAFAGLAMLAPGRVPMAYPAPVPAVEVMPGLRIHPRAHWGGDLAPLAPSRLETPRFILIHHTASTNNYKDPRDPMRVTYWWHTSATKGWPDVCYQFFIARDGAVFEGRNGALTRPVIADATGGSQGFAQLICFLGDYTSEAPPAAALDSLAKLVAWLAGRDGIPLHDGATANFVSRGSQRWAAGTEVSCPTVTGHRDMSYTACPGDALYSLLPSIRSSARAQLAAWSTVTRPAVRLGPRNQ